MLGPKTMEVEILRQALSNADRKNGYRGRSCRRRTVRDQGHRRHTGRLLHQAHRAAQRQINAAWTIPQGRGCRASALDPQASGFTPVASPHTDGMSRAFVKTLKRDCAHVSALPKRRSGSSTDGSKTTTKSIPISLSRWLPLGSSSRLNQTSQSVR